MRGLTIEELPDQQKPREKLLHRGVDALTDAEILAILLRTGVPGCNVLELAEQLLKKYGTLAHLSRCPVAELSELQGDRACQSIAHGRRIRSRAPAWSQSRLLQDRWISPRRSINCLGPKCDTRPGIPRDRPGRYAMPADRYSTEISRGTLNESLAHPREIFKPAISHSALALSLLTIIHPAIPRLVNPISD